MAGIAAGLVNGFFGSGGGMITVESMERMGVSGKNAHATSILMILPLSAGSAAVYFFQGDLAFSPDHLALLGGAAAGGLLGAFLLGRLRAKWIDHLFTALMLFSGIRMLFA